MLDEIEASNVNNTYLTQIYQSYLENGGFTWPMVACALALTAVGLTGIVMNLIVIWVTLRSKCLRGTANYMLFLCACYELLHQFAHFLFLYCVLVGKQLIRYQDAIVFSTGTLFGLGGLAPSMAFTGLDRLLMVIVPNMSHYVHSYLYLGTLTVITMGFATWNVLNFYATAELNPDLLISGSLQCLMQPPASTQYTIVGMVFNSTTVCIYILVGLFIRFKNVNSAVEYRLYRSLLTIICFYLGGYIALRLYQLLIAPNLTSATTAFYLSQLFSVFTNISAACNGPILYVTSTEYRIATNKEFVRLASFLKCEKKTIVIKLATEHKMRNNT